MLDPTIKAVPALYDHHWISKRIKIRSCSIKYSLTQNFGNIESLFKMSSSKWNAAVIF